MSEKKKKIENSEDFEAVDGITIINSKSLKEKEQNQAEKAEKKTEDKASDAKGTDLSSEIKPDVVMPSFEVGVKPERTAATEEQPSSAQIDLSGILPTQPTSDSSALNPTIDGAIPNDLTNNDLVNNNPSLYNETSNSSLYQPVNTDYNSLFGRENTGFVGGEDRRVFKTPSDVDASFEKFMTDVKNSYNENISAPTKTLVNFVNEFVKWGNQVTANGLNRKLFDEYDKLMEDLNSIKSYDDISKTNSYDNTPVTNFDDDQTNSNNYGSMAA